MQAYTFLQRHFSCRDDVLGRGERMRLAVAGNHCQGTLFRDGSHLITPQLEERIDQIARGIDGFFFGRFDVRYSDASRFKDGQDLAIVELNGATSESTNLYDPTWSLFRAYRVLFRQWLILFQIGHGNRQRGHRASSMRQLLGAIISHYRARTASLISD
jgi:hypothetical protein